MKMKVAFLKPYCEKGFILRGGSGAMYPPLGICSMATYIRENVPGTNVKIIDGDIEDDMAAVKEFDPDIIGLSANTIDMVEIDKVIQKIKKFSNCKIILGGSHISNLPHTLSDNVDIGVIGEGEQTITELVKHYKSGGRLENIPGIVFRNKEGKIIQTEFRKHIDPLDNIPHPDFTLLDMDTYLKPIRHLGIEGKRIQLVTSRGCVFKCVFCSSSHLWRIGGNKPIRFHSAEYVLKDIETVVNNYGVNYVYFWDDLFTADLPRLKKISDMIVERGLNIGIKYGVQTRTDTFTKDMAYTLKKMGIHFIGFGTESGSPRMLKYLKADTTTPEDNRRALKLANKMGFRTGANYMINNPKETEKDMQMNYDFLLENPAYFNSLFSTSIYPGTTLWEDVKNMGFVDEIDWKKSNQFVYEKRLNVTKMTDKELDMWTEKLIFLSSLSNLHHSKRLYLPHRLMIKIYNNMKRNPKYWRTNLTVIKDFIISLMKGSDIEIRE